MTAEPRPVEEIRADLATEEGRGSSKRLSPTGRLVADVEPLLARLAEADRENAELRGEVEALLTVNEELVDDYTFRLVTAERDDLRAQLAAAQAQLAEARRDYERVAATTSEVYCAITDGALSYPTYDARTILSHYEDDVQKIIDEECAPLTERAEAADARLEAVRAELAKAVENLDERWVHSWSAVVPLVRRDLAAVHAALSAEPQPEPDLLDEIGGDECGDLLPGDESLPLAGNLDPEPFDPGAWQPEPPASDEPARTPDLMAALRASVEAAKKRRAPKDAAR